MNKSLKYSDVFNNPDNNYVCPSFPTCSNSGEDDFYFEFIDKQSAGIVSNKGTILSMDLSDISSYAQSWSQENKVIQPNKALILTGDEYAPQLKKVVYQEIQNEPLPNFEKDYKYYLRLKFRFYKTSWVVRTLEVSINPNIDTKRALDLSSVVKYLNEYVEIVNIHMKFSYGHETVNEIQKSFLTVESTNENFQFEMMAYPCITLREGEELRTSTYSYIDGVLIEDLDDLKNTVEMDSDRDFQADVYWFEEEAPNSTIPKFFDTDGDGFVDVWWQDEMDSPCDIVMGGCDGSLMILNAIKYKQISISEYYKYINGAYKGILLKMKYPKRKDAYGNMVDIDDDLMYLNYVEMPESFKDNSGNVISLYINGPLYNLSKFINIVSTSDLWMHTSLVYLNIANSTELNRGLVLYNPHPFPIAVSYLKFN